MLYFSPAKLKTIEGVLLVCNTKSDQDADRCGFIKTEYGKRAPINDAFLV